MKRATNPSRCFLFAALLAASSAGCGDGKWGSALAVEIAAVDGEGAQIGPGDRFAVGGTTYDIVVQRACLSVGEIAVFLEANAGAAPGGDCFCHGDPPDCHGDCGEGVTAAGAQEPLVIAAERAVDLTGSDGALGRSGVSPGVYHRMRLILEPSTPDFALDPSCGDLVGRTFLLEGTLVETVSGDATPLRIAAAAERVTDELDADPATEATTEEMGQVRLTLDLAAVLGRVDFARLRPDITGRLLIGGPGDDNPEAAAAVLDGLSAAQSYAGALP